MSQNVKDTTQVPKRRGGADNDEHWLENLDLDRERPEGEDPENLGDFDDEIDEEVDEELEEEEEDFTT